MEVYNITKILRSLQILILHGLYILYKTIP
jgi:hypothetical protein